MSVHAIPNQRIAIPSNSNKNTGEIPFCQYDRDKQKETLRSMNYEKKSELLNLIRRQHRGNDQKSLDAMVAVSASMITHMSNKGCKDLKDLATNTLQFMRDQMGFESPANNRQLQKEIAKLNGSEVLARGVCIDCTDASKLFMELFTAASKETPHLKNIKVNYVASFDVEWAETENLDHPTSVKGHSIVQIEDNGKKIYVDAQLFQTLGKEDPSDPIFKAVDLNGTFYKKTGDGPRKFQIFSISNSNIPTSENQLWIQHVRAARENKENIEQRKTTWVGLEPMIF